jgi:phosphatidyl-myo-inositol dimannoside synthase
MSPPKTQAHVHFLTTDFPPSHGGLEKYAYKLATELEGICEVSAALGSFPPPPGLPSDRRWRWHQGRRRLAAGVWSSWDCLRSGSTDTIRLHMQWNTALLSAWQRKHHRLKRLWICAHGAELIQSHSATHFLMMRVLKQADGIVTGSRYTAKLLKGFGIAENRLRVLPYGVDLPSQSGFPRGEKPPGSWNLCCSHRLVARKGTRLLLSALNHLREIPWQLTLIGDGEERLDLEKTAAECGLQNRIRFLGALSEAEKLSQLDYADLFILPSLNPVGNNHIEGLGIGLLEAQAHGIAVLGAHTGGIPEAIHAPETGRLFEAGSEMSLRKTLQDMYTLFQEFPVEYAAMGQKGKAWIVAHFLWEKNLEAWRRMLAAED